MEERIINNPSLIKFLKTLENLTTDNLESAYEWIDKILSEIYNLHNEQ